MIASAANHLKRALVLCFVVAALSANAASQGRFSTTRSIEMTRIVDPGRAGLVPERNYSPDGTQVAFVMRAGDLRTGFNEYSLVLLDTREVANFVRSAVSEPLQKLRRIAGFFNASESGIEGLQWAPNGRSLAFIGRGIDNIAQVYLVDVYSGELQQLTREPKGVASFDLAWPQGSLLYTAVTEPPWVESNRRGYVVQSDDVQRLIARAPYPQHLMVRYRILDLKRNKVADADIKPVASAQARNAGVDPTGRWAVLPLPVGEWKVEWGEYDVVGHYDAQYAANVCRAQRECAENPAVPHWLRQLAYQFVLIDLTTGANRGPLLEAPAFAIFASLPRPLWSDDAKRILLPSTMLPLSVSDKAERMRRRAAPVIAEVTVKSGQVRRVADIQRSSFLERGPFIIAEVLSYLVPESLAWPESPRADIRTRIGLELEVMETLTTPPEIVARSPEGQQHVVTDLNPRLRALERGTTEVFHWIDRNGYQFRGGLVRPPAAQFGQRFPLVIQTHGFSPHEFLVDGPGGATSAFAALPLASRGIVVLQMDEDGGVASQAGKAATKSENPRFVAAVEGAIDALEKQGLIDPSRVGLIGWSRTGMNVHHFVTFSKHPIAAATVSDATSATPFCYAALYGEAYLSGGMHEFEDPRMKGMGGPPWGDSIDQWLKTSYFFHLDRIRAPLRYEHLGTAFLPCHWDAYAVLRRMSRPVEMIHIPMASHDAKEPLARYTSQQGNVDWFAFWLNGCEDPDPVNVSQYERWRDMRAPLSGF